MKTNWWLQQRTSENAERRAAAPSDPKPHIDVLSATKAPTPTFVFSIINDAATTQQEINKTNVWQGMGCLPGRDIEWVVYQDRDGTGNELSTRSWQGMSCLPGRDREWVVYQDQDGTGNELSTRMGQGMGCAPRPERDGQWVVSQNGTGNEFFTRKRWTRRWDDGVLEREPDCSTVSSVRDLGWLKLLWRQPSQGETICRQSCLSNHLKRINRCWQCHQFKDKSASCKS